MFVLVARRVFSKRTDWPTKTNALADLRAEHPDALDLTNANPSSVGFVYGDGVYELIPVYGRQPYRLAQHLARLQYSLDGIRLANPRGP